MHVRRPGSNCWRLPSWAVSTLRGLLMRPDATAPGRTDFSPSSKLGRTEVRPTIGAAQTFPFADALSRGRRLEMMALLAWSILLGGVSVRSFARPADHSVYPIFSHAAQTWLAGKNPYAGDRWPELDF